MVMLNAEEAAARLDSLRDPQWRSRAGSRISGLPTRLREPARAFLDPGPPGAGYRDPDQYHQRLLAAARLLDELPGRDRAKIMNACHPGLGPALTRWWVDAQDRPYGRRWDRRAFRTPHAPGLTAEPRAYGLAALIRLLGPFGADPAWLAAWAAHLRTPGSFGAPPWRAIGGVLAAAVDLGGDSGEETFATLKAVANGEHPAGLMGRHVIVALLGSSRPEGWEFAGRLLLAAQRQEGLRQAILEAADEGHPGAFDRILAAVLDHRLLRFAAAVRAAGVWLGFGASVAALPEAEERVRALAACRADPAERARALAGDDPWHAYVALCAQGMRDVLVTLPEAQTLTRHPAAGMRAAALRYAAATGLRQGQELLVPALDDPDVRVAALAASLFVRSGWQLPGVFGGLTRLIPRLPRKPATTEGLGVETGPVRMSQAAAAASLVDARAQQPVSALLRWLPLMDASGRLRVVGEIAEEPVLTAGLRQALLELLGDRSPHVRQSVIRTLTRAKLTPSEAPAIEALLTRAATDLRRSALTLLASLPPADARAAAARLTASTDARQRDAGTELLGALAAADDQPAAGPASGQPVPAPARAPAAGAPAAGAPLAGARPPRLPGSIQPPSLLGAGLPFPPAGGPAPAAAARLEDLRVTLFGAAARTAPLTPQPRNSGRSFGGAAAWQVVQALDELAGGHRNTPVLVSSWQGSHETLFGDLRWFPSPFADRHPGPDGDGEGSGMLLGEVFRGWWETRPAALRDDDGLDALRAYAVARLAGQPRQPGHARAAAGWWHTHLRELAGGPPGTLRHPAAVQHVTSWLAAEHATAAVTGECLDALETSLAMVPPALLTAEPGNEVCVVPGLTSYVFSAPHALPYHDWRQGVSAHPWHDLLSSLLLTRPGMFDPRQISRWYRLMRWLEQPRPEAVPLPPDERLLAEAFRVGAACEADVIASFLHPDSSLFRDLTRRWRGRLEAREPALTAIADTLRDRLVGAELQRGDLPTPATPVVQNISSTSGAALAAGLLRLLGDTQLVRGWSAASDSRDAVFSRLLRACFPAPSDNAESLMTAAREAGLTDARLVDLAVYAPQWAPLAEGALGWPGLASGVLWLHAHTRDQQWSVDHELRESWAAMTAERTPLSPDDLLAGAVDVAWFHACYAALGGDRWAVLHKAARHASGGNGHRRAQLFAEAMLGQVSEAALTERITVRRSQDAVRALGLLPLPAAGPARQEAAQCRYAVLREFGRGSAAFGSQRRASEGTAVRIGIENLARTAGYPDPRRFVWAVEAREAGDLAAGPVTVTHGDVSLTLSVTVDGTPELTVRKAGRALSGVPAALRKAGDVAALRVRKTVLTRQAARVRTALEAAMVAQDAFTPGDFAGLSRHPVVAPLLDLLIWVDEDGRALWRSGGLASTADGKPVPGHGPLRIAHPADLAASRGWVSWQERLFAEARRQPFKQAFRELYVLTAAEREGGAVSHRYDGHQLQPRQALALLGSRGWLASREAGDAARAFHSHGLVAHAEFVNGFLTPAEADLPAISGVYFTRRGEHLAQPLASIPPVVFSETMRDLDLVVSVAHAGGVDPEATASTTEMRAALVRETARLLKLANISFAGDHVLIDGALGEYSLHLGSGTVHRRPGGAVCIIPVGSQHRGRLFLPFADDDPKTAEIVSKALLLARDHEIRDPAILEQLRA